MPAGRQERKMKSGRDHIPRIAVWVPKRDSSRLGSLSPVSRTITFDLAATGYDPVRNRTVPARTYSLDRETARAQKDHCVMLPY